MFSDFPSLHPLVVHFPIVLILIAAALQAVAVWKPEWVQIRWSALIIMVGAFLSSLAASTLFHAMITADAPKEAMAVFQEHEKYSQYTLWMSGITLLVKAIGDFYKLYLRSFQFIVLAFAIASAIFLSIAGHYGATLTHINGVGPMGRYLMKDHDNSDGHHSNSMENMDMKTDSSMKMDDHHQDGTDPNHDKINMNGDTSMKMKDDMKGMDNMKDMEGMNNKSGQRMKDMPGMNSNSKDMKNMKGMDNMNGMDNMKNMKGMKGMENMKGMNNMKDKGMKGMENMPGMDKIKNMKDMKGMDKMKDMKDMKDMKVMPGMDTAKGMKGMEGMEDMKGMEVMDGMKGMPGMNNMKGAKLIDPSKPYDNNPAREKKAGRKKQE